MKEKEQILDDFEHNNINNYELKHDFVNTYDIAISNKHAKFGNKSLKLSYHFGGWKTGNAAMYIIFKENLVAEGRPLKLGMWVYGDGHTPWLRATFLDVAGDRKTVNLTEKNIDWTGWKYLDASIDASWLPVTLEQIYAVEVDKTHQGDVDYSGVIYFDQLRFVYVDDKDLKGPVFSDIEPERDYIYNDTFTFRAKVTDDMTGVQPETINVLVNGEETAHQFCRETQTITCDFRHVAEGTYHISVTAEDRAGNISKPGIEKRIIVDLSPDREKPIISNVTPTETSIVHADTPRITFNLKDHKSGVDARAIVVKIGENKLDVVYDEKTGWGYALADEKLASGAYSFSIAAEDRAGNKLDPVEKQFQVAALGEPRPTKDFSLAIIPDTHSDEYSRLALGHASRDVSEIVLHMGDMVDQGTHDEFRTFLKSTYDLLPDKRLLTIPGNHESFSGHLDGYMHYFGSPTYHLKYGNLLLIALNSSYEQSISASDSTQFHYLKRLLQTNDKDNVLIVTHVPTEDAFGTEHDMIQYDTAVFEQILSNYKREHENVHMTVLYGHLHVLHQWEKSGVNYIITGNGAKKSYVGDPCKSLQGYGRLTVSEQGMSYTYRPYLKDIRIIHHDHCKPELLMKHGSFQKLGVEGKRHRLNGGDYVDLTDIHLVKKQWFTSNEHVIKVDEEGIIEGHEKGEALISVKVEELHAEVKVVVV